MADHAYFRYRQYADNRRAAMAAQMENATALAQATVVFVDRTVSNLQAVGQALVRSHWQNHGAQDSYLQSVSASSHYMRSIALVSPTGVIIEGSPSSVAGINISDRSYFRKIVGGADWSVSDVLTTRTEGQQGFIVATGIRSEKGRLLGVVVSSIDDHKMMSALHVPTRHGAALVLFDRNGRIAMKSGRLNLHCETRLWNECPLVHSALQGSKETVPRLALPGTPTLTGAIAPIPSLGWAAGVFVPLEQLIAPARARLFDDLLLTVVVFVLTLLIGSIVARQFTGPVKDLSDAAERLGQGELSVRAPLSNTVELATLAGTMNKMAESIQQRDEALRQAYARERRIASTMQSCMLPNIPPKVGRLEMATAYFPAWEEAELGGDFYDVMILPGGLVGLVIADVSGKGLNAAVHTAMTKYMLEAFASHYSSPAEALSKLNRSMVVFLGEQGGETFVTLFLAIVDSVSGHLSYANAGHPAPILRHSDGTTELLENSIGLPLGISSEADYKESTAQLRECDNLVLYTDGVAEAHRDGIWFGIENLEGLIQDTDLSPSELVHTIYAKVSEAVGGSVPDDVALVAVRMGVQE
ncbi:MAG: SpoIIE family protein phosphatase [Chloroflexi bacterium]|nr:SpoIIE family protein phosphatase [Chloroflexota bacterium]